MATAQLSGHGQSVFGRQLVRTTLTGIPSTGIVLSFLYQTKTITRQYATDRDEPDRQQTDGEALRRTSPRAFAPFKGPSERVLQAEPNTDILTTREETEKLLSRKAPYPLARNRGRRSGPLGELRPTHYKHGGSGHSAMGARRAGIVENIDRTQGLGHERDKMKPMQRKASLPFEGLDNMKEYNALENSSISAREYQTFEKLFRTGMENGSFSGTGLTLDEILDQAVQRENAMFAPKPVSKKPIGVRNKEMGPAIGPAANEVEVRLVVTESIKQKAKELRKYRDAIDKIQTDAALWQFLQEDVFAKVKALRLNDPLANANRDRAQASKKKAASLKAPEPAVHRKLTAPPTPLPIEEADIHKWSTNFPLIINYVMKTFEQEFPGSPFAALVLPALKGLGPSEFTFGSSTSLFNSHINIMFRKGDLDGIMRQLEEMDRAVHPFDENTFKLLNTILRHSQRATRGDFGPGQKLLWAMEHKTRTVKGIYDWANRVREQLHEDALRRAREKEAAAFSEGLLDDLPDGPRVVAADTLSYVDEGPLPYVERRS